MSALLSALLRDQINFFHGHVYGAELHNPDFVKLAESFGAAGYLANSPQQFRALLEQALIESEQGPVVIEIPCERGSEASPFEFLILANYGR